MPQITLGQLADTRRNNFDFLRFFFASLVIFSHSYWLLAENGYGNAVEPLSRLTQAKINLGTLGVACFFGISGFLITQSWLRTRNTRDYFQKRVLRIYPGWIVAVLLCVVVVAPILRPGHALLLTDRATFGFLSQLILRNCGIVRTLPGVGPVDGSTWTIPFEIMCYGMVAALGLLGLFRRRVATLLLVAALLVVLNWPPLRLLPPHWPPAGHPYFFYIGWLWCLPLLATYFLSGAVFFLFRDRIPHSPWLLAASLFLVTLTLGRLPLSGLFFIILPTFGFYILFYLAFLPLGKLYAFAKHGDLSYGVYLYSYPIQRLLIMEQFRGYHLNPLTLFLVAWVLSCGAAVLSWRLVEKPFLRLKPRSPQPPAEAAGVPAVTAAGS